MTDCERLLAELAPPALDDAFALRRLNQVLARASAEQRIAWALRQLPGQHVLSSSFGAQAAVSLHLVTRQQPRIPVVLIDTGYLFAETYRFIDTLTERLELNLQVHRTELSPSWLEARYGRLWEQGADGIRRYNQLVKVAPMQQALDQLGAATWLAGLRRTQASSRQHLPVLTHQGGRWKVHPIVDWSNRDVHHYLQDHQLPYHPLWHEGFVSIGDVHTSRPLEPGMLEEETRFHGLLRECGLHELA
ncbi:MAG: phosphoadenylyl-sulfate reductase [Wenzhouxiangellaceae bacterium]